MSENEQDFDEVYDDTGREDLVENDVWGLLGIA